MSGPFCKIQPDNVALVRAFGVGLIVACAASVVTGKAYFRNVVVRDEEPIHFWCTVASVFILGSMCVVGSFVC